MAVKREQYPIPTIDEVLQDVNQSKFFSKLDLNSAFHQMSWQQSREISTHLVPMMACTDTNGLCSV